MMRANLGTVLVAALVLVLPRPLGAAEGERTSTLADQRQVGLTVYNAGIALVHDVRRITLADGLNHLAWRDVSGKIDATSVLLEDPAAPDTVSVLEQNFNYDLLSPTTLLQKYVGRDVTVVHPAVGAARPVRETARVLSTNDGVVLQYADRVETEVDGRLVFPSIPQNLRERPTLVVDLTSTNGRPQTLDLSYLTGGLSWRADYVGLVSANDDRMDLSGLVTLSNDTGTSFNDAKLQLVAGNVNVVQPPSQYEMRSIGAVQARAPDQFAQQNFFEYHLYSLSRPTTIADKQTKQIGLLSAHRIPVRKTLELRGSQSYYTQAEPDLGERLPVGAYFSFENRGGELGRPLPGGIVRLYKHDASGTSLFLGSDTIDHTPKNESVRLRLGDSFDVTARKKQTNFRERLMIAGRAYDESSYRIVLRNAKDSAVDVLVVEPIPGEWQIVDESAKHAKSSSSTATWKLRVPAGGSTTLTYTARTFLD